MGAARPAIRDANGLAHAPRAVLVVTANHAAGAAVVGVIEEVDATPVAQPPRAVAALPFAAVWGLPAADVAAGAAVLRVRRQESACPAATDRALDTGIDAPAVNACGVLEGTRPADVSASPTVTHVTRKIGAGVAAPAISAEAAWVVVAGTTGGEAVRPS